MNKSKTYKRVLIILSCVIVIAAILIIIARPKSNPTEEAKIEAVTVNVQKVEEVKKYVRNNRQIRYYLDVEYQGTVYNMGPLSVGGFSEGPHTMYWYNDHLYVDETSAVQDIRAHSSGSPMLLRIGSIVIFVSVIAWIGVLVAVLQNRDAKPAVAELDEKPVDDTARILEAMGSCVNIHGSLDYIIFDYHNDYTMRAYGELQYGGGFLVYKSSMKKWQPPHEDEPVTPEIVNAIIDEVRRTRTEDNVNITFS